MCKAFSCLVLKNKEVVWKFGVDSHEDLLKLRPGLKDNTDIAENLTFARCEYSPKNGSYLKPDKWVFNLDECIKPSWFDKAYENCARKAWKIWKGQLDKVLIRKRVVYPFKLSLPKITKRHLELLKTWASVRDSVRASVGASVWDSVGAYVGSFFNLKRNQWLYTDKIPSKDYPFKSIVLLWEQGLVPSFDGKLWRLHGGKKGKILWSGVV